ncbi:MAG: sugar transferase [Acidimicrobiales bacterium]
MTTRAGTAYRAGTAVTVAGLAVLHATVVDPGYQLLRPSRLVFWSVLGVTVIGAGYGLGLPDLPVRRRDAAGRAGAAVVLGVVVVSLLQVALAQPLLPRSSLVLLAVISPVWAVIGWNLDRDEHSLRALRDRVLVVAEQRSEPASLRYELAQQPEAPAVLVAELTVEEAALGPDGSTPLIERAEASGATVLVLDTAAQSDDGIVAQAAELHRRGVRIRTLALFYEEWLGKLPVAELARVALLFDIGELHRLRYVRTRRVIDLVVGAVGLVLVVPVAGVVWIGNRFANRGPLLFAQHRVGKDGRVITVHKFRTMLPNGDDPGAPSAWTVTDDPRVTPWGRLLRRSHVDELPQMLGLIRGELSLIGPRPEQVHYVEELREKIPFYDVRHLVRPGLTGWAQVKQGYAADEADAYEKLQYDVYYLRRQSLALDSRIAWRTVRGVMIGAGR